MANCQSNCGCSRGCGTLNSVYYRNYPYYTGPCPSVGCGCYPGDYPPPIVPEPAPMGAIGSFYAVGPVTVAAGGAVPLTAGTVNPCVFTLNGSNVTIRQPGTYRATYTVNVPADIAAGTTMTLNLNGAAIAGSGVNIETAAGTSTSSYTGQAVFTARAGDMLSLNTLSALSFTAATTAPIFTLVLERVG